MLQEGIKRTANALVEDKYHQYSGLFSTPNLDLVYLVLYDLNLQVLQTVFD